MVHAAPESGSYSSDDTQATISSPAQASQAAARAAYIARVVAEAPPLTDAQIDHIAVLLRPRVERSNATPVITVAQYSHWEIVRHLDSETPGRNGYFTAENAA